MGKERGERKRCPLYQSVSRAQKRALYERAEGHCEWPGGCKESDITKLQVDHITPRCIARLLGWSKVEANDPMNHQLLCVDCHRKKDETTRAKKEQVIYQMQGGMIGFGEHQ